MTALYLLAAEYKSAAETLADLDLDAQTIADTLDGLSGDIEAKAQNVAMLARSLDADAAAIAEWAKQATARAASIKARADSLRDYLARSLEHAGIERVEGPGVRIGWRTSTAVDIFEPAMIPGTYMIHKLPPDPIPDKAAIKAAIKSGTEVPGARIDSRRNLQIK
jgi:hypothetical protein